MQSASPPPHYILYWPLRVGWTTMPDSITLVIGTSRCPLIAFSILLSYRRNYTS